MESRVSSEQLDFLLDHLSSHPGLAKGYGLGGRSKETSERLWNELANILNAIGNGTSKTGVQWKRYWIDIKHKAKAKAAMLRVEHSATGGGPSKQKPMSDSYKKVLAIIGQEAACGDVQYRVPVFDVEPTSPPHIGRQLFPCSETFTQTQGLSPSVSGAGVRPNRENNSPSTHGNTTQPILEYAVETPCVEIITSNRPNETCPTSNIRSDTPQTPSRPSPSRNRRRANLRPTRTDHAWVVDLERRRIAAEEKLSEAMMIIAEAAKMNAQAAIIQAEAAQTQTKALLNITELLKK